MCAATLSPRDKDFEDAVTQKLSNPMMLPEHDERFSRYEVTSHTMTADNLFQRRLYFLTNMPGT